MQPTEMYFYDALYAKELEAEVIECGCDEKFGPFLILNRTICHPHGGGQKGDRGKIVFHEPRVPECPAELNIVDTRGEKGGTIKHIVDCRIEDSVAQKLRGAKVTLQLNWAFRYNQMRLHSSSHFIHIFMERSVGHSLPYPKISDILEEYGLTVYEAVLDIPSTDMPKIVSDMNEFLAAGHKITTYPDPQKPAFRYWKCEDIVIPCGGTHPHSTSEVGPITATLSVKKGTTKVMFRLS